MTALRTLPIRVAPLPGEALDSWIDALAFRMHMPAGDLLRSIGLGRRDQRKAPDEPHGDWMMQLQPDEAASIAAVTGTTASRVTAMTLSAYDGRALLIEPDSGQVNRRRLWGRNAGSRYCSACLAETGGRWSLEWRLGWSFACVRHQCLLSDACPGCGRMQRIRRSQSDRTLDPAYCGYPAVASTASTRCGTDLRDTAPIRLPVGHPALRAQQLILDVIDAGQASFGVYASFPAAAVDALADVRAIAGRALAPASADRLPMHLPPDLLETYQQAQSADQPAGQTPYTPTPHTAPAAPGLMAPSHAVVTAAGILAATDVLSHLSIHEAGEALRWLTVEARVSGQVVNPTTTADWGRGTTPVLDAVALASMQPALRPSHQLRYRVMSCFPQPPDPAEDRINTLARSTPTLLWPYWALRLALPNTSARILRSVLSVLVLLPGTKASTGEAIVLLGSVIDKAYTSRIIQLLESLPQWRHILNAITRLSDHLAAEPSPIDYRRRRNLSYEGLLPDTQWEQICRITGAHPGAGYKAHIARAYLFQRISTMPCDAPPTGVTATPSQFRADIGAFPTRLFPELGSQLDQAAQRFLAAQGIADEPVTWQPPLDIIDDLGLPGPDPASVAIPALHSHVYEGKSLGDAARELGTTLDAVRAVLAENPARARPVSRGEGRRSGPRTRPAEIPKEQLERLYLQELLSTRQIAARYHMHRDAVSDLLTRHGIPVRRRPPADVTPEWLRHEYVDKGRTFKELAAEVNSSPTALARWAKRWEMPVRPRGGSRPRFIDRIDQVRKAADTRGCLALPSPRPR